MNEPFNRFDLTVELKEVEEELQYQVELYDENGDWYAQLVGPDFSACLKHALYMANPILAAATFEDYFEWTQDHLTEIDKLGLR